MELFCIVTVVVVTEIYSCEKLQRIHTHRRMHVKLVKSY